MISRSTLLKLLFIGMSGILSIFVIDNRSVFSLASMDTGFISQEVFLDNPDSMDDNQLEMGVEWINDYPNNNLDLERGTSCVQARNALQQIQVYPTFSWADDKSWETDFKNELFGGMEDSMIDHVDFAMICAYGMPAYDVQNQLSLSSIAFSTFHNDPFLLPGEAWYAYGDNDMEYLVFEVPSVLSDYNNSVAYWAGTMDGLHALLGFSGAIYRSNYYTMGAIWALNLFRGYTLNEPLTITQAWFRAIDYTQPEGVCGRVLGERSQSLNEYILEQQPDDPVDSIAYKMDHCSAALGPGASLASFNQPEIATVPIFEVVDRQVNEDYVRNTIAPTFNMTGDIGMDEMFYYMVNTSGGITHTLQVDKITGSYNFMNTSELWITPEVSPTLPDERQAVTLLETWLRSNALALPGAWYRNAGHLYVFESENSVVKLIPQNRSLSSQPSSTMPVDGMMTYRRLITGVAGTASGSQLVDFPIVGPGAQLTAYLGDQSEVIGLYGGTRDVQVMGDQVTVLDASVVWSMFLANHDLAIPNLPYDADSITYTAPPILGYYEMPYLQHQEQFIPVWIFIVDFYTDGIPIALNLPVYLPAAMEYMPPQVTILSPEDGAIFWADQPITFEGSFTGGTPPYTILWTGSMDGELGSALSFTHTLSSAIRGGEVFGQDITFEVIDANGLSGTAMISLKINPVFWLPFARR